MTYQALPYGDSNISVIKRRHRKAGNPYPSHRSNNGRFKTMPRSLTIRDKVSRQYPYRVYATLSATEHQRIKELSANLGLPMTDILAYLITNHLEQLAHQASFELGQQSAIDNIADNPPENPSI